MEFIAPIISALALGVSLATAYLTLFRRGTVRMTQPTVIWFGPDGGRRDDFRCTSKIFLRTLLFATGKRGQIVEQMFIRIRINESSQTFNIWVYGDDKLARGSGLYVGENGVTCNHHFLLPSEAKDFQFRKGSYELEVHAVLLGRRKALNLFRVKLFVDEDQAIQLQENEAGLYFDWGPDSQSYHSHLDHKELRGTVKEFNFST